MGDRAKIIEEVVKELLFGNKSDAIKIINLKYCFNNIKAEKRSYSDKDKCKLFYRDGFIDRYTGDRLVNPGILKVLSIYFPEEFPYQAHWKMEATHFAYWELVPTVDHIYPISLGGEDDISNMVTTSMLHNSIKSNWTLDQMNWRLHPEGHGEDWDGLSTLFIDLVDKDQNLLNDNYIKKWYRLVKNMCS